MDFTALRRKLIAERDLEIDLLMPGMVEEVVQSRMEQARVDAVDEYVRRLSENPDEYDRLVRELVAPPEKISGDPELTSLLETQIIPSMLSGKERGSSIRIWIPNCGRGYLVYEMALVLQRLLGDRVGDYGVRIVGTDAGRREIAAARARVSPLGRIEGQQLAVPEVRKMMVFGVYDPIVQAPYPRMDLIVCRGYMPLLDGLNRSRVRAKFVHSLVIGGQLVGGRGETVGLDADPATKSRPFPVFTKRVAHAYEMPLAVSEFGAGPSGRASLLDGLRVPILVVNPAGKIIAANQAAVRDLKFDGDPADHTIWDLQPNALAVPVHGGIRRARTQGNPVAVGAVNGWVAAVSPLTGGLEPVDSVAVALLPCDGYGASHGEAQLCLPVHEEIATQVAVIAADLWAGGRDMIQLKRQAALISESLYVSAEQLNQTKVELQSRNVELEVTIQELQQSGREREEAQAELQRALDRERHISETLQAGLLPPVPERAGGLALGVKYRAAFEEAEVGGDFYHTMRLSDDRLLMMLGDVSGKGLESAVFGSMAKYTALAFASEAPDPEQVLLRLNEALVSYSGEGRFITLVYFLIDLESNTLHYASGGHEPIVHYQAATGMTSATKPPGMAIGVMPGATFQSVEIKLGVGDVVLAYTDGLSEAGLPDHMLGSDGIAGLVERHASRPPSEILDIIYETATKISGGRLRDDAASVLIKRVE